MPSTLLEDLDTPTYLVQREDALVISTATEILLWANQELRRISTLEAPVDTMVGDSQSVYWVSNGALYQWEGVGEAERLIDLGPKAKLSLTEDTLYVAHHPAGGSTASRLLALQRESLEQSTLLTRAQVPNGQIIRDISQGPTNEEITYTVMLEPWPHTGRVCLISKEGGTPTCLSDSPPQIQKVKWYNGELFWTSRRALLKAVEWEGVQTYEVVSQWHRGNDLLVWQDQLLLLDQTAGKIWQYTERE